MLEKARNIKAIFFDVDGTLYDHSIHDFPQSTKEALQQLGARGYQLYIATSRSEQELIHVWDLIEQFSFSGVISCGGALTRLDGEIVDAHYLDEEDARIVISYCRENKIDMRWQSLEDCFFDMPPRESSEEVFYRLYRMIPETQAWNGESLLNVLCYVDEEQRKELKSLLTNCEFVDFDGALEIVRKDVHKAQAIADLVAKLGLDLSEVAAFGDGENDIKMLSSVGIGIAMGNGCIEAKEAADMVSEAVNEHGIAIAARMLGFIGDIEGICYE